MKNRLKWFREASFGMLVCWGIYTEIEHGECSMFYERLPKDEYNKLAWKFNPKKCNIEEWVKIAKNAGMKYMVFVARHIDGFCLFDSKTTNFTSVKMAAKRDFTAEFVRACRKHGMRIGIYYNLGNLQHAAMSYGPKKDPEGVRKLFEMDHNQVRELMSNYGKIDILWYDNPFMNHLTKKETPALLQSHKLNAMVRKLQPEIIINNRALIPEDFSTPEQNTNPSSKGRAWESCMTIGEGGVSWGYYKQDNNLKSVKQLMMHLVNCALYGGNYLIGVGPKADGTIQKEFVYRFKEIGTWMKKNSESIYNTDRVPEWVLKGGDNIPRQFGCSTHGVATVKGNNAYLHLFRWTSNGEAIFIGIKNKVRSAEFLATGKKVEFEKLDKWGKIILKGLPKDPPDKYDTVIKLELAGKPECVDYYGEPV